MTLPPSQPPQNSTVTGKTDESGARSSLSQQTSSRSGPRASALSPEPRRRILSPISTSLNTSSGASSTRGNPPSGTSHPSSTASPLTQSFSSVLSSSVKDNFNRHHSSSSSSSTPVILQQSGGQQLSSNQLLSSPRSKITTPTSHSQQASSAAASTTASQGGGGGSSGGGGPSRIATFSPSLSHPGVTSPHSPSSKLNATSSPSLGSNSGNQAGQLSKIVIAQVFLLLSTIKEDKDKTKWEAQADQIRKLIDSNGMEVFSKYFKRLLVGNAPQIFPGFNRPVENGANYPLLLQEVRKGTRDLDHSRKIAETIDAADGDLFRDFDLSTFMEHFKLDALEKTVLALPFKTALRSDLRTKSDAILSNNFHRLLDLLSASSPVDDQKHADLSPTIIARIADGLAQYPPPNLNEDGRARLAHAIARRYQSQQTIIPLEVSAALQLIDILVPRNRLARLMQTVGPSSTSSPEYLRELIQSAGSVTIEEIQVAAALLFILLNHNCIQYNPTVFTTCLGDGIRGQRVNWQNVVQFFDREGLRIDRDRFLALYNALQHVTANDNNFDIQALWGGRWENPETQLSFITAFTSLPPTALDASSIPRLRAAFSTSDFAEASDAVKEYAEKAVRHPLVSLDAMTALFDIALQSPTFFTTAEGQHLSQEVIQPNMDIFICAAMRVPQPWTDTQQSILVRLFIPFLLKEHQNYDFVLHCLWKQNKQWVATRLVEAHSQDPMQLPLLLSHAQNHGWLDELLVILNGFGLDLAALAHRRGLVELDQWAQNNAQRGPEEFAFALCRFLTIKAEDEMKSIRNEQRTVSLAVKTVYALLQLLDEVWSDDHRDQLTLAQRLCIQAYPRLINYGEGFDNIIDANGEESNAIPSNVDTMMQEHYKRMYSGEREVRDVVEALQNYKRSREPADQDLFACMIHGLFDEYSCYHEYPLEALATTAVLFGGIINYNLISGVPLDVGLGMILEAVKDHAPESSMYKFGLQALLHCFNRLQEWPGFCSLLLQVPGLHGTEAYHKAEEVVRENADHSNQNTDLNGITSQNGINEASTLTNGNIDEMFPPESSLQDFASVHVDPPLHPDASDEPSEDVQDKVLFVLNNVSEQNLETKLKDLKDVLEDKHYQWFAGYLVEERAKMQPNFHTLYLDMLSLLGKKTLWAEVLRETYISVSRMLNAQSTMESSTERAHLKNLGGWLGSLTIGRDKPIKHKNISFKDLLIEAYDTQRLIVIIPFTCKVLAQASKSLIFKPPNPWTMSIIAVLVELYDIAELRLQLKFEIEVLCKDLDLDHRNIEPARSIRDRPQQEDNLSGPTLPDGLDGFDDLALPGLGRPGARNDRFSPAAITSSLPDIGSLLVYPPTPNTAINRESLRYIVETAVRKAIQEIISPVVERSVTIAAISTTQLIHKDFAMEPDEERVRQSALHMVKRLAGSLALVTCKEPLRMSMTNHIRIISAELGDQALPEGAVLMCVNDNLDTACSMVESAAEQRSMPEIEENIEQQLSLRRNHRAMHPNQPYVDPILNKWSFYIPEPYKQSPNGLNKEQMAIYQEFAKQSQSSHAHANVSSAESSRQALNDTPQEPYPQIPNLSSSTEPSGIPPQHRLQPQSLPGPSGQAFLAQAPQLNGFSDNISIPERSQDLFSELQRTVRDAPEQRISDLNAGNPIFEILDQILRLIDANLQIEELAIDTAKKICQTLFAPIGKPLEVEVNVQLLKSLCDMSLYTSRNVTIWLANEDDERFFNGPVTVALVRFGLLELERVDSFLSRAIQQKKAPAVEFLGNLLDELLFVEKPVALRADFASSLEATAQWLMAGSDLPAAKQISQRLRESGVPDMTALPSDESSVHDREQLEYTFDEWVHLCIGSNTPEKSFIAFIQQLHRDQYLNDEKASCLFFRICIDMSVDAFEQIEAGQLGPLNDAYIYIDALAKLVVRLVRYQGGNEGEAKTTRAEYMNSIMSLIIVVLNHHHVMRGERFNQRVFFRLFSTILCEYQAVSRESPEQDKEMITVFGNIFLILQPAHFPGFVFGWLTLVSHRIFMPRLLLLPEQTGWSLYSKIMESLLYYVGELVKPLAISGVTKDLYRGALRILLVLHHDFPEFLADNHFRLCNAIPAHCAQLRNLILSAYPSSFPELPDPFTAGLKVDRISEIRNAPALAGDFEEPLRLRNIKATVDAALVQGPTDDQVNAILKAVYNPPKKETGVAFTPINVDTFLITSLVIYTGASAINRVGQKGGPTFVQDSPQATLLTRLANEFSPEARYYFLSAIVNQLRYPNNHTHYFSYALLFLFGSDQNDQRESDIRQQITRVLLERLIVHRPHPWGLIITLLELFKNPTYMFWELPFIKAAPEIERLFGALFTNINQSQR
ncbi:MAG: kinetochore-associated Ndc80 complex subunit ndc80 [Chaenotheca gracillima]|nr:MAG: kinetochore-associated Ndc80 complex subunit ndc80 [Chaenotheca gracillima]